MPAYSVRTLAGVQVSAECDEGATVAELRKLLGRQRATLTHCKLLCRVRRDPGGAVPTRGLDRVHMATHAVASRPPLPAPLPGPRAFPPLGAQGLLLEDDTLLHSLELRPGEFLVRWGGAALRCSRTSALCVT